MLLWIGLILLPLTFCSRAHTKGANSQTAGPASGCHLFLSTGACQGWVPKGQQLFPLASSMPEPGRGSWLVCQLWADFTSSQSFISPSSPCLSSYGKNMLVTGPELCLQDMKSSAAGGCNSTCQVPKEPSSNGLGFFVYSASFLFLLFQENFYSLNCFWFWQCLLKIILNVYSFFIIVFI